jgi:DNA repair protein RecN (Recombination protein N)
MIKKLFLKNFVLVQSAEIAFNPHFNVITGETGAGKTAIIEAISLCLGSRADTSLIRQGCERALVEGTFSTSDRSALHALLKDAGIDPDEELIIRREITLEGKNKAYINCCSVPLPFLQRVGAELIDFVGQHALLDLKDSEAQRALLDMYGNLGDKVSAFQLAHKNERALLQRCEELQAKMLLREKQADVLRYQLEEIETASLKAGEDEALFETYKRLTSQSEICEKLTEILDRLAETPSSIITQLNRLHKLLDSLVKIDPIFSEPLALLEQAQLCSSEAHLQLHSHPALQEQDPKILSSIEERLSRIAHLKKKYGPSWEAINAYKDKVMAELSDFENAEALLREAESELAQCQKLAGELAQELTRLRAQAAKDFAHLLTSEIQLFNMSKAEVRIELEPQKRSSHGQDAVHFWLKANPGEAAALVAEHSSGGEISRLFLAIKIALADKNQIPSLIFDEIDANVGGKTASIIGDKLAALGKLRQILCITHFPQVAAKAEAHFVVHKEEKEGRTVTEISPLSQKQREQELVRMLGGNPGLITNMRK